MSQATILETLIEIDNKVSTSTGQSTTHTDLTQIDTDLVALKTANHTDLSQVHTDLVAVEGKQDTGNTSLASIDTKTPALGQALAASSVPVVLTVAQLAALASATLQTTGNTSLAAINTKLANDFGVSSGAIRTASQVGNATGAADFNAGVVSAQTPRVILASDQLNSVQTGSASANNTDLLSYDTSNNYRAVYFQIIGTFVGTISFQQSSDNFTTTSTAIVLAQNSQSASAVSTATTNGVFIGNVAARYWRARFTAYSSGTATINAAFSPFPYSDIGNAKQVTIGGQPISVVANAVSQGGSVSNNLVPIALGAITANPTAVTGGQYVRPTADKLGRQATVIGHVRDLTDTTAQVTISSTAETTIIAQVAAVFQDIYSLDVSNTSAVGLRVDIRDTTGGTVIKSFWLPGNSSYQYTYNVPLKQSTVNTNWTAQLSTTPTSADVRISTVSARNL